MLDGTAMPDAELYAHNISYHPNALRQINPEDAIKNFRKKLSEAPLGEKAK